MSRSRDLCIESALRNGVNAGNVDPWDDSDLVDLPDDEFLSKRPDDPRRALGWWSWKPAIIDRNLNGSWCKDGDIVIYSDAGIEFIAPVSHIINRMDQDIFLFSNMWMHSHWCKRNTIETIWPITDELNPERRTEKTWARFGKQVQASVIFFRVSDYSRKFVAEWLKWCLFNNGVLIDDSPAPFGNHPEFQEHRHDQSVLTCMAYRDGLKLHWWPAVYNRFVPGGPVFTYEKGEHVDTYPPIFHHHRLRNSQWPADPFPAE